MKNATSPYRVTSATSTPIVVRAVALTSQEELLALKKAIKTEPDAHKKAWLMELLTLRQLNARGYIAPQKGEGKRLTGWIGKK